MLHVQRLFITCEVLNRNNIETVLETTARQADTKPQDKKIKISFDNTQNRDFATTLRSRIDAYFKDNNLSKYGDSSMYIKTIVLFACTYIPYFVILTMQPPLWISAILCMVMGFFFAGIGFGVGHDALHGSYTDNPKTNRLLGLSFNIAGANDFLWKIKHNQKHHTFTNIFEHDEDISVVGLLRFSPGAERKWFHKFQHLFAFPAYCFLSLHWVIYSDFDKYFTYEGIDKKPGNHPKGELFRLIAWKLFYFTYILAVPLMFTDYAWYQVLTGFLLLHMVMGLTLSTVFQLAHIVEETTHPAPDEKGKIHNSWIVHEMETTANFAVNSKAISWFVGGLNFQVEHHLFPNICSIHYPELHKIVKTTAAEFNVPYHYKHSFGSAIASHYRVLKQLALND